jgi:hypothetical protein
MTNILTAAEAANFVRTDTSDAVMLMLLPQVDAFIKKATGHDWTADGTINDIAKAAAGMLLVQWYDNPAQAGNEMLLSFGIGNVLGQLEAEALKYRKVMFRGLSTAGSIVIEGAEVGDDVISLVGVYGVSGDQRSKFESEISVCGALQQTNSSDLSGNRYVVVLKSPAADVSA